VIALLVATVMVDLLSVVSTSLEIDLLERAIAGETITDAEADANDVRQGLIALLRTAMFIGTVIVFLLWSHRAHRNLPALGAANLRFKPRDAVIYFFIPIMNLFRPYQVMKEIWYASHPTAELPKNGRPSIAVLGWWWGLFLYSNWIAGRAFRLSWGAETLSELKRASGASLFSDLMDIPAAVLAIALVHMVNRRQEEKHAEVERSVAYEWPGSESVHGGEA
jgi:hypothetical protein